MLPRINVVLPDGPEPRRPVATSALGSDLPGTAVTLHEPTDQEMLQFEYMQLLLNPKYTPKHPKAWKTRKIVLRLVAQNGLMLKFVSRALRNDKEVVMAAVTQQAQAIEFASEALKNDKEVVMAAVTQNGFMLMFASEALQNDKEVIEAAKKEAANSFG